MLRRHGRKRLTLSVASTDKALTEPIVLAVPGRWRLAGQFPEGVTATAEENLTRVHVPYRDYMPVQLDLRRRSWFDAILGR